MDESRFRQLWEEAERLAQSNDDDDNVRAVEIWEELIRDFPPSGMDISGEPKLKMLSDMYCNLAQCCGLMAFLPEFARKSCENALTALRLGLEAGHPGRQSKALAELKSAGRIAADVHIHEQARVLGERGTSFDLAKVKAHTLAVWKATANGELSAFSDATPDAPLLVPLSSVHLDWAYSCLRCTAPQLPAKMDDFLAMGYGDKWDLIRQAQPSEDDDFLTLAYFNAKRARQLAQAAGDEAGAQAAGNLFLIIDEMTD